MKQVCDEENIETGMNRVLARVHPGWRAVWVPDPDMLRRGEVDAGQRLIIVYDVNQDQAWETFTHELLELKLRPLLGVYREIINQLIAVLEKVAYSQKERLIEELPALLRVVGEAAPKLDAAPADGEARP